MGNVRTLFERIAIGQDIKTVAALLGLPLRFVAYSRDPHSHPLPSGKFAQVLSAEDLPKWAIDRSIRIVMKYSLQKGQSDWWRFDVVIEEEKVVEIMKDYVTE